MEHLILWYILGGLFIIGYIAIVLEHNLHINKSGTAVVLGALSWITIALAEKGNSEVGLALSHETQEIFGIVVFLLAAMTIVEVLVHYRFFDWVQEKIMQRAISQVKLFWLLGFLSFFFSAFLDNLTTTLIMIQLGRKIYKDQHNFLIYVINTVIAANAGGVASPIGDVTTIMLWLANKFSALQVISIGILPAVFAWMIPQALLTRKIKVHEEAEAAHLDFDLVDDKKENPYWPVIIMGFMSFAFPVAANFMGLPPFLGLLLGVGLLWIYIDWLAHKDNQGHSDRQIIKIIQKTDISTLKFFIGILLAVGALSHAGLLKELNLIIFGSDASDARLIFGNVVIGLTSAVLDNVPLVAAAIKMFSDGISYLIWVLLALTAGTGGSILAVGSAAGVAAMGQVKELTFGYYLKNGTLPAMLGYFAGIAAWLGVFYLLA